jgi:hypothetical protein
MDRRAMHGEIARTRFSPKVLRMRLSTRSDWRIPLMPSRSAALSAFQMLEVGVIKDRCFNREWRVVQSPGQAGDQAV